MVRFNRYKYPLAVGASLVLGLILGTAGLSKALNPAETFKIFMDPFNPFPGLFTPEMARMVIIWLPRIEIVVALLLIIGVAARLVAAFSSVLIAGFIYCNSWLLVHGLGLEPCDCLSLDAVLAQGEITIRSSLYIDIGMLALVLIILFYYPGRFVRIRPWYLKSRTVDNRTQEEAG